MWMLDIHPILNLNIHRMQYVQSRLINTLKIRSRQAGRQAETKSYHSSLVGLHDHITYNM